MSSWNIRAQLLFTYDSATIRAAEIDADSDYDSNFSDLDAADSDYWNSLCLM